MNVGHPSLLGLQRPEEKEQIYIYRSFKLLMLVNQKTLITTYTNTCVCDINKGLAPRISAPRHTQTLKYTKFTFWSQHVTRCLGWEGARGRKNNKKRTSI